MLAQHRLPQEASELPLSEEEPRNDQGEDEAGDRGPHSPLGRRPRPRGPEQQHGHRQRERQKNGRHELRQEAQGEVETKGEPVPGAASATASPREEVISGAAITEEDRAPQVVGAHAALEHQRPVDEQEKTSDRAAHRTGQTPSNGQHVHERHRTKNGVPEPESELVSRQQADANRRGYDPELQRRFFEEDERVARAALRPQPLSIFEDAIGGKRVDSLVGLEVETAETDEQRQAEQNEDESQPGPAHAQSLMQVTSDQIRGRFTFSMETGLSSACVRKAGRSRSDLKPM